MNPGSEFRRPLWVDSATLREASHGRAYPYNTTRKLVISVSTSNASNHLLALRVISPADVVRRTLVHDTQALCTTPTLNDR